MSLWARYGRSVGEPDELTRRRIERRVLERLEAPPAAKGRRATPMTIAALGLAAAVLLAIGWGLVPRLSPDPAWVEIATTGRAQEVSLPHAGSLWVGPDTRVELAASDETGAVVRLREGEVALDVDSGEGLRWSVEADGYRVEAVGTRFSVRRTGAVPDVHVEEGVVRLTGPGQPEDGLLIRAVEPDEAPRLAVGEPGAAGERGRDGAEAAPTSSEIEAEAEPEAVPTEAAPASSAIEAAAPPTAIAPAAAIDAPTADPDAPPTADEPAPDRRAPPPWIERFRDAVAAGDDAAAVAALPAGFPTGREPLSPSDFLDAGDALASQRQATRADAAYRAACRRARVPACGIATFRRALMADRSGDTTEAIRLATRYLDDHPDGSLAPEVLARRMRWHSARGSVDAARRDARSYLARWPDGPHHDLARRTLGEPADAP